MAALESNFCKLQEFNNGKEKRLKEEDYELDPVYMAFFALRRQTEEHRREALKTPVKLLTKEVQNEHGIYVIRLSLLDQRLEEVFKVNSVSYDGFLTKFTEGENQFEVNDETLETPLSYPVSLGYLRKYEKPKKDGDKNKAKSSVDIAKRVLAAA